MPHIQPFPQDVYAQSLSDYTSTSSRPAYHQQQTSTTTTTTSPRPLNESRNQNPLEASPVVVPSMSPYADYPSVASSYYQYYYLNNGIYDRSLPNHSMPLFSYHQPYHHLHQSIPVPPPIHHTLEKATITYDTIVEQNQLQKDLVKDVFFSPAMITSTSSTSMSMMKPTTAVTSNTSTRATSPSSEASTCSQSDDSESEIDSPKMTPSDLLLEKGEHMFFFSGFDLSDPLMEEEKTVTTIKSKPNLSLCFQETDLNNSTCTTEDLPTPPAETEEQEHYASLEEGVIGARGSLKRKALSFPSEACQKKHKPHWGQQQSSTTTPPASPAEDPLFDNESYFDDASAEESSDDDEEEDEEEDHQPSIMNGHRRCSEFQLFLPLEDEDDEQEEEEEEEEEEDVFLSGSSRTSHRTMWEAAPVGVFVNETSEHDDHDDNEVETCRKEALEQVACRPTSQPTLYQKLTKANIDWCRYCGTTEGVNWRPGPWGKRTLCNKHGCDYKGYGFACKLPRLDLTGFCHESIDDRDRPVLQLFCSVCHRQESWAGNVLVRCEGCPKAFHQKCCPTNELTDAFVQGDAPWFCDPSCCENARRKRIVVELPRKRLPLMCAPKNTPSSSSSSSSESSSNTNTRTRSFARVNL
ncbi:hypothetical protein EC973_002689 [Apophysomyces ossiformis]|uniref:Zinc finger PHD-type domain-containing protein n=1 Tax=Apophysomyces ossiformis TaxID=679940 RepID=A0A8H7EMF0_9FUNG|nr:hypothetical protein EC973_002689 [Apophysomyces ossiformis]